eukprot:m.206029 g.206029  ORF g.206029 m.206029 type:complete len:427 (-) comp15018_c1_seq5:190-1470(-)
MSQVINRFTSALRRHDLESFYQHCVALRLSMKQSGLITSHKYHMKTYKECFVGTELVKLLVESGECASNAEAELVGYSLSMFGVIHHVCDDHMFKNDKLFFRFCQDDGTYDALSKEWRSICATAVHVYALMRQGGVMIQNRDHMFKTHNDCFVAREFIPWCIVQDLAATPEQAIALGTQLKRAGFIHSVSKDSQFKDSYSFYRFSFDKLDTPARFIQLLSTREGGHFLGFINPKLRLGTQDIAGRLQALSMSTQGQMVSDIPRTRTIDHSRMHLADDGTVIVERESQVSGSSVQTSEHNSTTNTETSLRMIERSMEKRPWFFGFCDHSEATDLLSEGGGYDGLFLLRLSSSKEKVMLSLCHDESVFHIPITCWGKRNKTTGQISLVFSLTQKKSGKKFESLDELVEQCRRERFNLPTRLTHCCPKA